MSPVLLERLQPVPVPDLVALGPRPVPDLFDLYPPPATEVEEGAPPVARRRWITRWSIPVTLLGLLLVLGTAFKQQHLDPGLWGLLGSISITWYIGLAVILVGIGLARTDTGTEAGIGVVALVTAVTATPSIVYDLPRYTWTAKHLGVVNFILANGHVDRSTDLYQAWAGLFSGIAWLTRAGGLHDPMSIARIWPPVVDVLTLVAVRVMAGRLLANPYRAWIAAGAFALANAIGQDYFSPQAISVFLAVVIYAIAVPKATTEGSIAARARMEPWRIGIVVFLSLAISVTHQITPYLVGGALVVLVVFGLLRPLWIPLVPVVPAALFAWGNWSVLGRYFSISTIGNVTSNVATTGGQVSGAHKDIVLTLSTYALALGPLLIGVLALAFVVRNHNRQVLAIAACALSAGSLVLATNYGNEGVLRVTIFALPWLAILAVGSGNRVTLKGPWALAFLLAALTLTFVMANMALDGWNVVRPSQVSADRVFEASAPKGATLIGIGAGPLADLTASYPNVNYRTVEITDQVSPATVVDLLASGGHEFPNLYILTSESASYYGQLDGLFSPRYYDSVVSDLKKSTNFRLVFNSKGAQLFELRSSAPVTSGS